MATSTDSRSSTIGFIGLGLMGNNMLNNLVKNPPSNKGSKCNFAVFDVNDDAVTKIIQRHKTEDPNVTLTKCSSPYEIAKKASIIISMVPTGAHVRDVYCGPNNSVMQALQEMSVEQRDETLCMDESTIEQAVSKEVAQTIRTTGADMLDAPVSGGVVGAKNGTLAIMCGGSKASFDRAVPFLQPMASKVTHCGDLGTGLAAKIANNLLLGITMAGLSEAMLLGKTLGVDPQVLADIINNSTGRCWSSEINHPVPEVQVGTSDPPAHRGYEGGFVTKLAHKDLALAVSAAETAKVPLTVGRRVEESYRPLAKTTKWGNRDFSVMYEALQDSEALALQSAKL